MKNPQLWFSTIVFHHQKKIGSNENFIRFRYMSHSEILLDIEHEVLYFLGTPSTIEGLRLRVPNLWSPPALSNLSREFKITQTNSKLKSEKKADIESVP